ncbi:SMI1/KNR4 family protein [Nonomuraea sp. MTCD27]|uniref:SMI1/KNR4 family protein n=1 Tax=Nonomuraea sp. MTCD27 TaxID=1676747 RepID=UPI0035BF004E
MRPSLSSWPWWPIAVVTYVAWVPAEIITALLLPPRYWGADFSVVPAAYAPMSPVHRFVDGVSDISFWPVGFMLWVLAWLAPRRPSARAQLRIGTAAFSVSLAELAFAEADTILDSLRTGAPPVHEHDLAGLVWFYGPPLLITVATWAGLREARGIASLPVPYRPARRTKVTLTTFLVLILATGEAPPPVVEQPPPALLPDRPVQTAEPETESIGCRPRPRRPVVRRPARRVTARVDAAWARLDRWLARNAPRTYRELNPPAEPTDIARAEARMGVRFPDDLKASLLRHDGAKFGKGSFFFVYRLTPVKEIVNDWKVSCEVAEDVMPSGAKEPKGYVDPEGFWWHGSAIPFAMDGGGDNLVLDGKGRVGHFFHEDGLSFTSSWAWPSYVDFLEDVADALESGEPLRDSPHTVTPDGDLDWSY